MTRAGRWSTSSSVEVVEVPPRWSSGQTGVLTGSFHRGDGASTSSSCMTFAGSTAAALTPLGKDGLDCYVPTVAVPTWAQMIDRLIGAGFSKCYFAGGEESHLGAWTMDCVWYALQVWHGMVKPTAKGSWVGNSLYTAAATQMAADCGVELSHWTYDIGGTVKPVAVGNVMHRGVCHPSGQGTGMGRALLDYVLLGSS